MLLSLTPILTLILRKGSTSVWFLSAVSPFSLTDCLSNYLCVFCLNVCVPIYLSLCLSIYLVVCVCVCRSVRLSVNLSGQKYNLSKLQTPNYTQTHTITLEKVFLI